MLSTTFAWWVTSTSYNLQTTATCTCPNTTQSPLKALLNTCGTCHKIHTMHEAPHLHRRWPTQQCSAQQLPSKWLSPPTSCTTTAICTCPETIDNHPWRLCLTPLECATSPTSWQQRHHDTKDVPATQNSAPLDLVPPDHTMPVGTMNPLMNTVEKLTFTSQWHLGWVTRTILAT